MRIVFFGTPDFALPVLQSLLDAHDVAAVITQPDRPRGRGHTMQFSPVKKRALERGIPVFQPEALLNNKEARNILEGYGADIFIAAAYGLILPKKTLALPPLGCVNVHASLLPKYRGASPIHAALLNGDKSTGITVIYMDAGIDTGDMILKRELEIKNGERFPSLHDRMAELGGQCILEALRLMEEGRALREPQDNDNASCAPLIRKTDGHIQWNLSTEKIINLTRAFDPWPGPYSLYKKNKIKIWRCVPAGQREIPENKIPGTILALNPDSGFLVQTGDGVLWVTEMQAESGKRMPAADYMRGRGIDKGAVLE